MEPSHPPRDCPRTLSARWRMKNAHSAQQRTGPAARAWRPGPARRRTRLIELVILSGYEKIRNTGTRPGPDTLAERPGTTGNLANLGGGMEPVPAAGLGLSVGGAAMRTTQEAQAQPATYLSSRRGDEEAGA